MGSGYLRQPDTEGRYSQLERESLGVVFVITRFRQYILGRTFESFSTHQHCPKTT
jgi:hypothetical protein